jgi:succinoglycan biosynthesis transport protein ExoP
MRSIRRAQPVERMDDKLERIGGVSNSAELPYALSPEAQHFLRQSEINFQVHLLDYWKVLIKRWWIVVVTLIVFAGTNAYFTWQQPPVYRASLKLQIDNEQTNILPFKDSSSFTYIPTDEYLKTQFEALTSRTLATRVIRAMNLEKDPRFVYKSKPGFTDRIWQRAIGSVSWRSRKELVAKHQQPSNSEELFSPLADSLLSAITISPIKESSVVILSVDARDSSLAADIVNKLAAEFIQMNFETKYNATIVASNFLAKQLVDIKLQVEKSEENLVNFGQTHNIYTLGEQENVIMQKLGALNSELISAQAERIQKESIWRITKQSPQGALPDSVNTSEIKVLENTVAGLQQQHAKLRAIYKPDWYEVKQIAGQLETTEKQLARARAERLKEIEISYYTTIQREKLLSSAVSVQKAEADILNQNFIQYNILKQEADSNKQIYVGMLQRMKEAGITAGLKSNNIHVVDAAIPPGAPILPDKKGNLTKALLSGLIFGIALAFLFEYVRAYFDRSLKTPEDVDRFVKLPFLGLIPAAHSMEHIGGRKTSTLHLKIRNSLSENTLEPKKNGSSGIDMITLCNSKSMISEAYRHLRTSILLSAHNHDKDKTIVVTSSKRGEGKTSTSINLAITLAQANKKVLLMDCDLRNPKIHRILGLDNQEGISSFLSANAIPLHQLVKTTSIPNLFVLTSGKIPPNPAELVGSPMMKKCLAILSQRFDHVLVDTPPLLAVTDGSILANIADGVVLVIRGGDTTKEAILRSKYLLNCAHARIIGTMLNNVDLQNCEPSYYARYFYDYDIETAHDGVHSGKRVSVGAKNGHVS